jgi:hypothetical protein
LCDSPIGHIFGGVWLIANFYFLCAADVRLHIFTTEPEVIMTPGSSSGEPQVAIIQLDGQEEKLSVPLEIAEIKSEVSRSCFRILASDARVHLAQPLGTQAVAGIRE